MKKDRRWWTLGAIKFPNEEDGSIKILLDDEFFYLKNSEKILQYSIHDAPTRWVKDKEHANELHIGHGHHRSTCKVNVDEISEDKKIIFCTECGFRIIIPEHIRTFGDLIRHFEKQGCTYEGVYYKKS